MDLHHHLPPIPRSYRFVRTLRSVYLRETCWRVLFLVELPRHVFLRLVDAGFRVNVPTIMSDHYDSRDDFSTLILSNSQNPAADHLVGSGIGERWAEQFEAEVFGDRFEIEAELRLPEFRIGENHSSIRG